ncbi:adaptor protein MecA [Lacticaseibacillus zhaodongensis]|uniref:adaptor protein MecA n=1 Tax=Lacticaseibacillus zhaodongensis TaxID=2668065 RepID=UPI0018AFA873|nr:adaptor protein MecA [Lacticaseibacillus zhaodongensis]
MSLEMERINDDTIRVFMNLDELNDRGIKMLDLVQDHKRVEDFFYSVLDEVDAQHTFMSKGPVTFQVMPSGTGLEIYISRTDTTDNGSDADDFDIADAFQPDNSDKKDDVGGGKPDRMQQIAQDSLQPFKAEKDEDATKLDDAPGTDGDFFHGHGVIHFCLHLPNFEALIGLSKDLFLNGGRSDLYKYQNEYYLVLTFDNETVDGYEAEVQANIAREYGDQTSVNADVLSEYGNLIMGAAALETTRFYFK